MERLPMETLESIIGIQKTTLEAFEKHGSEDSDYCPAYDKAVLMLLEELKQYRIAEEQGLLLRLPCKVGDTVYHIEDGYIYEFKAKRIDIRKEDDEYIYCIDSMDYRKEHFGKIAFLTLEEAEQALARMEKENG